MEGHSIYAGEADATMQHYVMQDKDYHHYSYNSSSRGPSQYKDTVLPVYGSPC